MKKWNIQKELKIENGELKVVALIDALLENRGITTAKDKETFLHPKLVDVTPKSVGIDAKQLKKALARIYKAIEKQEPIIVFGDYDVDGITGSAILWETLHSLGAKVLPYIPHRVEEGYGLSVVGISNQDKKTKLIITVDNGIVAHEAVAFANEQGIDVIITDHHVVDAKLPAAFAIVHTTKLCGAGVAYLLSKELKKHVILGTSDSEDSRIKNKKDSGRALLASMTKEIEDDTHLELATLGTVADMVPLTGANRAIVSHGLERVRLSKRPGLQALYQQAGLNKDVFSPYDIGFVIAPRLNASGRIANAMDSLRLLCTKRKDRAEELALKLEVTNKERQQFLRDAAEHAIAEVKTQKLENNSLLIVSHESYQEGVIGLVAGKLVEAFYRPAIVIARRDEKSKASVRSISGFNIIEFLRIHKELFVNVGGHPMAAGFTVATENIALLTEKLTINASQFLTEETLTRTLSIDCVLPFSVITQELYEHIQILAPFGMGNPEPVFMTKGVMIQDLRILGKEGKHLKLVLKEGHSGDERSEESRIKTEKDSGRALLARMTNSFEAIAFGMGELAGELHVGDTIDVAYVIDENVWNGRVSLQLKLKDIIR